MIPTWKYPGKTLQTFIMFSFLAITEAITTLFILAQGGYDFNLLISPVIDFFIPVRLSAIVVISWIAILSENKIPGTGHIPFIAGGIVAEFATVWNLIALVFLGVI